MKFGVVLKISPLLLKELKRDANEFWNLKILARNWKLKCIRVCFLHQRKPISQVPWKFKLKSIRVLFWVFILFIVFLKNIKSSRRRNLKKWCSNPKRKGKRKWISVSTKGNLPKGTRNKWRCTGDHKSIKFGGLLVNSLELSTSLNLLTKVQRETRQSDPHIAELT